MVKPLKAQRPQRAADRAKRRAANAPPAPLAITLPPMSLDVVNMIIEALGQLPMARVEPVVNVIRAEAQRQVQAYQQANQAPAAPDEPPNSEKK